MRGKSDAINHATPQWIKDLDPSKDHHARALRIFHDPGRQLLSNSCTFCLSKDFECFIARDISMKCARCIVRTRKCDLELSDDDSAFDPVQKDRDLTSNDKSGMSSSNGLKRKRGDPSATAEAGQKVRQRLNAAEASSSQSSPSLSRTNSNDRPHTTASKNLHGPLHLVDPRYGMAHGPPVGANLNNLASPYPKPLVTRPCSHGLPNFNPVNQPPANQVSTYASPVIPNQVSGSGLVGSDHNQANKHNGHGTHDSDKEVLTPHQNFISPDSRQKAYSVREDSLPSAPRISIEPHKLDNTTLWISIPSSSDATPITLRSCMTMLSLFDTVCQLCDLDEQQGKVLGLRTSFDWQQNADMKKSLMLKRRSEHSFEIFLEMINASPSWESDGRCSVTIEVVMAPLGHT